MHLYSLETEADTLLARTQAAPSPCGNDDLIAYCWAIRQRDSSQALALANQVAATIESDATDASRRMRARIALVRAEILALENRYVAAETELADAKAGFADLGDSTGEGDSWLVVALLAVMQGQRDRYLAAFANARALYLKSEDPLRERIARAWQLLLLAFSNPKQAGIELEAFRETVPDATHAALLSLLIATEGQLHFSSQPALAAARFLQASELAREAGMLRHAIVMAGNAGAAYIALGQFKEAAECLEWAVNRARETGWPSLIGTSLLRLGELLRDLGDLERSRIALEEAVTGFANDPAGINKATAYAGLAQTLLRLEKFEPAISAFETAISLYRDAESMDNLTFDLIGFGQALALSGQRDRASEAFAEARRNIERYGFAAMEVTLLEALSVTAYARGTAGPDEVAATDPGIGYLEEALQIGARIDGWLPSTALLMRLAERFANASDYSRAYNYSRQALEAERRENTKHASNQVAVLQVRHETELARSDAAHHRQLAATHQQTSRTLSQLGSIGQQITANLDAKGVLSVLHDHVRNLADIQSLELWFYDDLCRTLRPISHTAMGDGSNAPDVPLDHAASPIARCARDMVEQLHSEAPHETNCTTLLEPLVVNGCLTGVMAIQSLPGLRFGEQELLIFRTLCAYSAIALDNTAAYRKLKEAQQKLEEATLTDPLTGLRNRRFVEQHLPQDILVLARDWQEHASRREPVTLNLRSGNDLVFFLVDLDHFKAVNDTHGHAAGDAVLVQMRERLTQVFRGSDYLIRWGGEEFLIVARNTPRSDGPMLAERLRRTVADSDFLLPTGTALRKTCSIGFAAFPFDPCAPHALDWHEVVNLSDTALYAAKHAGRDCWVGLEAGNDLDATTLMRALLESPNTLVDRQSLRICASRDHTRLAPMGH